MNLRPASLVIACAGVFVAWRCAATLSARVRHAAEEPIHARIAWLTADRDARIDSTFGADASMVRAIETHLPTGATLMLYGAPNGDSTLVRDRLVLLQIRLYFLHFPTVVSMAMGPIADPARYATSLTPDMWLLNVTPDTDRPLAEHFDVVVRGAGFELSRCVRSGP